MIELSGIVPDGMVCFFTSYKYMEHVIVKWNEMGILQKVLENKLIFIETKDNLETVLALQNYKQACDNAVTMCLEFCPEWGEHYASDELGFNY